MEASVIGNSQTNIGRSGLPYRELGFCNSNGKLFSRPTKVNIGQSRSWRTDPIRFTLKAVHSELVVESQKVSSDFSTSSTRFKPIMERNITLIKNVTPTTTRPWTAKVTIAEKNSPRDARSSSIKFQSMVLADSEDNRVQLTLFGESINMFKDRLQLYGSYYISNAIVKPALKQYQTWGNLFQWSLHSTSLVEEVNANEATPQFLVYDFIPIENLLAHHGSAEPINMLFIALQVLPQKNISIRSTPASLREIIVTDRSLKPLILTLWDNFEKHEASDLASIIEQRPILAAIRIKLVSYDGLSVASRGSSAFLINPPIEAAVALRTWMFNNKADVDVLSNSDDLISVARAFARASTEEISSLASIQNQTHTKLFHTKCSLKVLDLQQQIVRKSCCYCNRPTSAPIKETYTCNFCGKKNSTCLPSLRIQILGTDSSGNLTMTMYGKDVAFFFNCNSEDLLQDQIMDKPSTLASLMKSENKFDYKLQVKVYNQTYMGSVMRTYTANFTEESVPLIQPANPAEHKPILKSLDMQATLDEAEKFNLTSEEKKIIQNILDRQQKTEVENFPCLLLDPDTTCGSLSTTSFVESAESVAQCNLSITETEGTEIVTQKDTGSTPTLGDEFEWNSLMKGPDTSISPSIKNNGVAEQRENLILGETPSLSKKTITRERIPEESKKKLKIQRK